nr:GMC family oxidoreductase N-terminal domain-containing protein [Streptomyces sp. F001]
MEQGVVPVLRGKVIGGSSSVNGANALRPTPEDLARWTALGNDRWSWDQVLPYLKKLEDDPVGGELHGTGGPVHIQRFTEGEGLRPVMSAFLDACAQAGHPIHQDMNGSQRLGAGPLPSTAPTASARARPSPTSPRPRPRQPHRHRRTDRRPRRVRRGRNDGPRGAPRRRHTPRSRPGRPLRRLHRQPVDPHALRHRPAEVLDELDIPVVQASKASARTCATTRWCT